jgi:hypothetical protein
MKIINLIEELIVEASKKDVLIQKLGFSEDNADLLSKLSGALSVWLGNKLIEYTVLSRSIGQEEPITKQEAIDVFNRGAGVRARRSEITSIMDWIRVGLNGNVNEYKNVGFGDLYKKSREWHESLDTGSGEINYVEENKILRDYRKDGIGFF